MKEANRPAIAKAEETFPFTGERVDLGSTLSAKQLKMTMGGHVR